MDYIGELGPLALASRLRRLLHTLTSDGEKVYQSLNIKFKIKWFPVLHLLANHAPLSLMRVAEALGMAHPSAIEVIDDLTKEGLILSQRSKSDRRQRDLSLSTKGKRVYDLLQPVWEAFEKAGREATTECGNDFLESIEKMERALNDRSMYERIMKRLGH
jgi:DNA-binding MarR family transcriptional regulator